MTVVLVLTASGWVVWSSAASALTVQPNGNLPLDYPAGSFTPSSQVILTQCTNDGQACGGTRFETSNPDGSWKGSFTVKNPAQLIHLESGFPVTYDCAPSKCSFRVFDGAGQMVFDTPLTFGPPPTSSTSSSSSTSSQPTQLAVTPSTALVQGQSVQLTVPAGTFFAGEQLQLAQCVRNSQIDLCTNAAAAVASAAGGFEGQFPVSSVFAKWQGGMENCQPTPGEHRCDLWVTSLFPFTRSVRLPISFAPVDSSRFVSMVPKRLLDSRVGLGTGASPWVGGETRSLTVAGGATSVPANATAVVLNVTGVFPSAGTHLSLWPAGEPMPVSSMLNLPPGDTRPNLVVVKVGTGGQISIFNNAGQVDVVADVLGYFVSDESAAVYTGVAPTRILDSRDGTGGVSTRWATGESRNVSVVDGISPVPSGATAVALNVTVTNASAASHLTISPAGATTPLSSNLNYEAGETVPNSVVVGVGANGAVAVFNNAGTADVIIDVVGYYSSTGSAFTGITPKRVLDSRDGTGVEDPWVGAQSRAVTVAGNGQPIPPHAKSAVLNVTGVSPTKATHLTVWPTGTPKPLASNLNLPAGDTRPNLVTVDIGTNGQISIYNNSGDTHIVADVVGYYV